MPFPVFVIFFVILMLVGAALFWEIQKAFGGGLIGWLPAALIFFGIAVLASRLERTKKSKKKKQE